MRDCCLSLRRLPALSWVRGFCLSFRGVLPDRDPLASVLQGDTEALGLPAKSELSYQHSSWPEFRIFYYWEMLEVGLSLLHVILILIF